MCKGTLCSCCVGPMGNSCHPAGLRILGWDLNHQGHLQSRPEWRLCHHSWKGHLGPTKSLGPHQLPTWPRCIVIWAADKAQRSRITGLHLGFKISYPWGWVQFCCLLAVRPRTSDLFPLSLSLPTCEMGANHCEDTCALTYMLSPVTFSKKDSANTSHL